MDGSDIEEKSSFKIVKLPFSSELDWGHYIVFIAKTVSKKIKALTLLYNFLLQRLPFISKNLPYALSWKTVGMSGVMFLINTFYLRLILYLLTLLNPWFIAEMETVKVFSVGIRMVIGSVKN